jgi:hypothetical protein
MTPLYVILDRSTYRALRDEINHLSLIIASLPETSILKLLKLQGLVLTAIHILSEYTNYFQKMPPPTPSPKSGFLAIRPHTQPVLTFEHESEAASFQAQTPNSNVGTHNKTWVYLPFPKGLKNSHYTIASHNFTFEFDSESHAKAFCDYVHHKGDLKVNIDGTHPGNSYFRVCFKNIKH